MALEVEYDLIYKLWFAICIVFMIVYRISTWIPNTLVDKTLITALMILQRHFLST